MEYKLIFVEPSEKVKLKHGQFTCAWCRKGGIKTYGDVCTYRNSISWRKDTCSCKEHRPQAVKKIRREISNDKEDLSEADYQTWMRV